MFQLFSLCLIILYFWYFYHFSLKSFHKPTTPHPHTPTPLDLSFAVTSQSSFQFKVRNDLIWEHTFQDESYLVQAATGKIVERDDCHNYIQPVKIPATGWSLYNYLKKNPDFQNPISFQEDSAYVAQRGNVFYFTCVNRQIEQLHMCPSGTVFQNQVCVSITSCTGKPDYTTLPVPSDIIHFIECKNGREFLKSCPHPTFYHHNACVSKDDDLYLCQLDQTTAPQKLNDVTLFECQNYKPVFTYCPPKTKLFGHSIVCEPTDCVGLPDGTRLPLQNRVMDPFDFIPGYMQCHDDKVSTRVECPQTWDTLLSKGDNLTHLPMVLNRDTQVCAVPTFHENVFSIDPDVIVPVHEFTKHVQNWRLSGLYDRLVGYVPDPPGRKRKQMEPGMHIGKRFKSESACTPQGAFFIPIADHPDQYYDCFQHQVQTCPPGQFFNGIVCKEEPPFAFWYRDIPFFHFDSLNDHGWMDPWEYPSKDDLPVEPCATAQYHYLPLYNICSHPECKPLAFLALVPDVSLFLPQDHQARCTFDTTDRHLKKIPVTLHYTFWDQRIRSENENRREDCTLGQHLKTGHYIWDQTLFATCDPAQPFVFCPSHLTQKILRHENVYLCAPPVSNSIIHTKTDWTLFSMNEIKRIRPIHWTGQEILFRLNRADATLYNVPEEGFEVPKNTRVNLWVSKPVILDLRYRVTLPPNAVFEYDHKDRLQIHSHENFAFHVRLEKFNPLTLKLPTFRPQAHVNDFSETYHPM